jgi:hypothetical protein
VRYAARKDNNDKAVVEAVKAAGFSVIDYTRAGIGIPDKLALRYLPDGTYFICWLEIKSPSGKLSENQLLAKQVWEPRGEWIEARNPEETVRALVDRYEARIQREHWR